MQNDVKKFLDRLDVRGNFEDYKLKDCKFEQEKNLSQDIMEKLAPEYNDQVVRFFYKNREMKI